MWRVFFNPLESKRRRVAWSPPETIEQRLLLSASPTPLAAIPANYAGTWQMVSHPEYYFQLNQNGKRITGSYQGPDLAMTVRGVVKGNDLKLRATGTISGLTHPKIVANVSLFNFPDEFKGNYVLHAQEGPPTTHGMYFHRI